MSESSLWVIVIGSIFATYVWRYFGAVFSQKINPDSALFKWVTCVSYAMLGGLISRMVFMPIGPLEVVPGWIRISGIAVGLIAFFLFKKQVLIGVGAGLVVFTLLVSYH